ncbi:hypothetical protein ACUXCC_001594 [Cytobacillus horneckiae]|uniref:DUF1570 domain-containing protein n=1 Tax=Cytobacillus horneckiae TaxID=549687 RepID=A0A2N0ZL30_9BACI|nr:hypothetical protein [Cytobacillus horneckiae]MBN6885644.1 hypothetical protein [Cytobacillus horneckiae]MEC1156245.1 hypothetical protein [Cytobacillus horneckiae]MED2938263.1 hypothetical protein [Cytobacillus horneckiae]PKG30219.1 hypothetical protein CWS20_04295 [Cytobacillus horneckiae]
MKKAISVLALISIFFVLCYKEVMQEHVDKHIVITEDSKVTFEIISRTGSFNDIASVEKEVLEAYDIIHQKLQVDDVSPLTIKIIVEKDRSATCYKNNMNEMTISENNDLVVHKLTHILLGYGLNFDASNGYLTQEGFAIYMESKYGKQSFPNFGISEHKMMKYLIDSNKEIPLSELIDGQYDGSLFRPFMMKQEGLTLQWISFIQAGSFITYLINTYGLIKFESIYNSRYLARRMEEVYGKDMNELEQDWIVYVRKSQKELKRAEQKKIQSYVN